MKIELSDRGFEFLEHEVYPPGADLDSRLASQSSAIGDYDTGLNPYENAGTSYLWIGSTHHLNREEVAEFAQRLNDWLKTGSLDKHVTRNKREVDDLAVQQAMDEDKAADEDKERDMLTP